MRNDGIEMEELEYSRTIFKEAAIAILVIDKGGVIIDVNDAFCKMVSFTTEELLGSTPPYPFWPKERIEEIPGKIRSILETGSSEIDMDFKRKDGVIFPVRITSSPIFDSKGDLAAMTGFVIDLDKADKFKKALAERNELLKAIFEGVDDAIFTKDCDGIYTLANKAFADMAGLTAGEIVGKRMTILNAIEIEKEDGTDEIVLSGKQVRYERTIVKNGRKTVLQISKVPLYDGERRKVIGMCGIVRDITEQTRMAHNYLNTQRVEALINLAGDIAHDFNNIVCGITGLATLVLSGLEDDNPIRKDLEEILNATEQAGEYTRKLQSLGNNTLPRRKEESAAEIIQSLSRLLQRTFPPGIRIVCRCEEGLETVCIDRGQIERAILNICINSADAMPEGGLLRIEAAAASFSPPDTESFTKQQPKKYLRISVIDNGEGMSEREGDRALEPFFTTHRRQDRAGLGLPIAYRIIKDHGGTFKLESKLGEGTRADILLPLPEAGV